MDEVYTLPEYLNELQIFRDATIVVMCGIKFWLVCYMASYYIELWPGYLYFCLAIFHSDYTRPVIISC